MSDKMLLNYISIKNFKNFSQEKITNPIEKNQNTCVMLLRFLSIKLF